MIENSIQSLPVNKGFLDGLNFVTRPTSLEVDGLTPEPVLLKLVCYQSLARSTLAAHIVASSHPVTTISPTTIIQTILDGISIYI